MAGAIRAAENDLLRAAENLLDNAAAHTPRGGTVTLTVAKENNSFILRVTDTGPGFTPEALAKQGKCSTPTPPAAMPPIRDWDCICEKVAQFHGGTLVLSNLSGTHGACAELRLPIGR